MAAVELFFNHASTTVAAAQTAVTAGTTQSWTVGSSATFVDSTGATAVTGTSQFRVVDPADTATVPEIILVTNVSGTTWSVTRGADNTTPTAHASGFTVQAVATSASLTSLRPTSGGAVAGTLLGLCYYAPTTPTNYGVSSSSMTALDTTNLKVTFTTAASGPGSTSVLVKLQAGGKATNHLFFGLTGTGAPGIFCGVASGENVNVVKQVEFLVTGLTASTSYTWNFAAATDSGNQYVYAGGGTSWSASDSTPALMKVTAGLT